MYTLVVTDFCGDNSWVGRIKTLYLDNWLIINYLTPISTTLIHTRLQTLLIATNLFLILPLVFHFQEFCASIFALPIFLFPHFYIFWFSAVRGYCSCRVFRSSRILWICSCSSWLLSPSFCFPDSCCTEILCSPPIIVCIRSCCWFSFCFLIFSFLSFSLVA